MICVIFDISDICWTCFEQFELFEFENISSHSNMAGVGEEGGIWGAGARNYDNQAWGVTRQGHNKGDGRGERYPCFVIE